MANTAFIVGMNTRLRMLRLMGFALMGVISPRLLPRWTADRLQGTLSSRDSSNGHDTLVLAMRNGEVRLRRCSLLPNEHDSLRTEAAVDLLYLKLACGCHHLVYGWVDAEGHGHGGLDVLDNSLRKSIRRARLIRSIGFAAAAIGTGFFSPVLSGIILSIGFWYVFPPGTRRARLGILRDARESFQL